MMNPSAATVEAALDKVLSSAVFSHSPRLRRFLEFVVRHSLAGHDDRIKEYTLGVEVFDRGPHFNPRCDSIVRVEAVKLREKLLEYYRSEGATDAITISMPKGSYRPVLRVQETLPAALLDDPQNLCCQAESLILQSSPEALARARFVLECAIARWPNHADLHVALASAALTAVEMELMAPSEGIPLLERAARRALHLDPRAADAHFYAAVPHVMKRDKTVAMDGAHSALRAAPRSAVAHYWVASVRAADLRIEDMLTHMQLATQLQPHALFFQTWRAVCLFWAGKPDTAIRHLRDILAFQPCDVLAGHWLGHICACTGQHDEARDAAARAHHVAGTTQTAGGLAFVEAMAGRVESAEAILESLTAETRFVAGSRLAAVHVALGNLAEAARVLERAQSEGDFHLGWSRGDQRWTPLRGRLIGV